MDNRKTEKKELNLEELSRAVGGAGGGISYTVMALKEKHETDRGTIRCLRSGMCPNYNKQAHTKVLDKLWPELYDDDHEKPIDFRLSA